jgi:hypothetical protein
MSVSQLSCMAIGGHLGENTLHPPKIVIIKIEIMHLVFFGTYEHHILDFFAHFKSIALALDLI